MTVNNHSLSDTEAHEAVRVVNRERKITSRKITETDRFRQKVRKMETVDGSRPTGPPGSGGGGVRTVTSTNGSLCGDVIEAFEDTMNNCEDTRLEVAMSGELGEEIASLLLRNRRSGLNSDLKGAILLSVDERQSQLRVLEEALETEEESVRKTLELVDSIDDSLVTEDTLIRLDFDELRQRHGTLIYLREDCEERIQERQNTLSNTTKEATAAGLRHMSLIEYLYEELSVEHPVLSTLTEAVRTCERNEKEVRKYICKAV